MVKNYQEAQKKLGIKTLTQAQETVLKDIAHGDDVCVMLRTGGGKSALFQIPAMAGRLTDLTVVFSPMIALQQDQLTGLDAIAATNRTNGGLGFRPAALLNSTMSAKERNSTLGRIRSGALQLLYLAPEQLRNTEIIDALAYAKVVRIVVDEAHVLAQSQTGFRSAYSEIGPWIATLPSRPQILAFSATMTKEDVKTIKKSLGMVQPMIHRFSIKRDNLDIEIKQIAKKGGKKTDDLRYQAIDAYLRDWNGKGSAVVYCTTVKQVEEICKRLKANGWDATSYHGKQKKSKREKHMTKFMSGDTSIMVATSAFGLGVDKPDVRLVIHAAPPVSLDGYVQEMGRAGRDGKRSRCIMLYAPSDWAVCKRVIRGGADEPAANKRLQALRDLVAKGKFSWKLVEKYFGVKK